MFSSLCCAFMNSVSLVCNMFSKNSNTVKSINSKNSTICSDYKSLQKPSVKQAHKAFFQCETLSNDSQDHSKNTSIEYLSGFEDGYSSMYLQFIQYQEKYRMEYEKFAMLDQVFNSYLLKAQLELDRINGKNLCDLQKLRSEISSLKSDLYLLRVMIDDFIIMGNQQMSKIQSLLQQQGDYHIDNQVIGIFLYLYFIFNGHYPCHSLLCN